MSAGSPPEPLAPTPSGAVPGPSASISETPATRPRRLRRWLPKAALALLGLLAALALHQLLTWPDVAALATENPETTAFIERYKARAAREGGTASVAWRWVPYGSISSDLKHAVVAAEDLDFFSHQGFDWDEMERAVDEAREDGRPLRGASTITQQLAKNLWLSPSRNPWRKAKEALLTRQLERRLGKRRILELYLNVAEFGPGVYGAEAAARRFFGKPAAALSAHEAAQLAAGLPRPSMWHPGVGRPGYLRHVSRIEGRMAKTGWVRKEL